MKKVILALFLMSFTSPSWKDTIDKSRYIEQRVRAIGSYSHNGDDVLVIQFSNGKEVHIRARQSHLIYENR